ncbi:toxin-antitoxin system YwqK family antitoxin [Sphingobacterium paludis]|uniref:MORN repeat protein n=1 Tax=Sphingobacterium paludis TaxID=1476465 RepID=A0A4V3E0X0_9SPHI|nr:hypothetical protein [Sphingobacterium paludis]TDS08893.1 hypothetical protein B0I21_11122 [Sphingobacterium paludis]
MSDRLTNAPLELIVLNGLSYRKDNLKEPFSGTFNWSEGNCDVVSIYENGIRLNQKIYEENRLVSDVVYRSDGSENVSLFDDEGNISVINNLKNGKLDGVTKVFIGGVHRVTMTYRNGKKNGNFIIYDLNGHMLLVEYYVDNIKTI